jgi:hypothetical protein
MPDLAMPDALWNELSAANARLVSQHDAPNGRRIQVWSGGHGDTLVLVLAELHPDGKTFLWQPLAQSNPSRPNAIIGRRHIGVIVDSSRNPTLSRVEKLGARIS